MIPFALLGTLAGGLVNGIFKGNLAAKQQRMADAIHPVNTTYEINPYANKQLGLAEQAYNSRMPSAGLAERNIFASQGNSLAFAQKNATDSSQLFNVLGGVQGQTNDALSNLQAQEEQYKLGQMGNLNNAYATMINEGDKVYRDKVRRYESDLQAKMALQGAAIQNQGSLSNDIASGLQLAGMQGEKFAEDLKNGGKEPGMSGGSIQRTATPESVSVANPVSQIGQGRYIMKGGRLFDTITNQFVG